MVGGVSVARIPYCWFGLKVAGSQVLLPMGRGPCCFSGAGVRRWGLFKGVKRQGGLQCGYGVAWGVQCLAGGHGILRK